MVYSSRLFICTVIAPVKAIDDIKPSQIPTPKQGYQLEALDDELFLYDIGNTQAIHLNSASALVWQLCDGHRNIQDINTLLQDAYPDKRDQITQDLYDSLSAFLAQGMIQLA